MKEVKVGDKIIATDEGEELVVTAIVGKPASDIIDFLADYVTPIGRDIDGNQLYANRGFNYKNENFKVIKEETK